ncbi:MAG: sigma factor-like helix-turn-helix DNA-binding protein [Ktedonobacteraceae bacterium]
MSIIAADDADEIEVLGPREVMAHLLATLIPDERRMIELRYHLVPMEQPQGNGDPRPLEWVGAALGLTTYAVLKKEDHAFLKLRSWAEQLRRKETRQEREQE